MIRFSTMALMCLASACMCPLVGCEKQAAPKAALPQTPAASVPAAAAPATTEARPATSQEIVTVPTAAEARLSASQGSAATKPRQATLQEIALVADGTQLYSPESGKSITKNSRTLAVVYEGRLYFLCCPTTMTKCQTDPRLLQDVKAPNGYDLRKLGGTNS